jgi:hypothetical protein
MPGSPTTSGHMGACDVASIRVAFHTCDSVGPRNDSFAAQWLACALPYRRFARTLAGACARLRADAVRYSFTVVDFHHLLLAGFTGAPHARVFDHAGPSGHSRITHPAVLPSDVRTSSAPGTVLLSRLYGWPMRSPVNASRLTSRPESRA